MKMNPEQNLPTENPPKRKRWYAACYGILLMLSLIMVVAGIYVGNLSFVPACVTVFTQVVFALIAYWSVVLIVKLVDRQRSVFVPSKEVDDGVDLIRTLWNKTVEGGELLLRNISKMAFIVFLVCGIVYWEFRDNPYFAPFLLALTTTLFTIWLVQIVYSSQMDQANNQRINLTLMQIFQRKKWLQEMDASWRRQAVEACYMATLGDELGKAYHERTYTSQENRCSYRKNFRYDVSLQRRSPFASEGETKEHKFIVQSLRYEKRIKCSGQEINRFSGGKTKDDRSRMNICTLFEFREDPFLQSNPNDLIFFREEIRSDILIYFLRKAAQIAAEWNADEECLRKLENGNEFEPDKRWFWRYKRERIEKLYGELLLQQPRTGHDVLRLTAIAATLLEYRLVVLDANTGQRTGADDPFTAEPVYDGDNLRGIKFNSSPDWKKSPVVRGADGYDSVYCSVECGYPIDNHHSFYWKFEEPIIAPQFHMQFPDAMDMEQVQVVQYFSDNKQVVEKSHIQRSISFSSKELFLPESGIYIHWPKETEWS